MKSLQYRFNEIQHKGISSYFYKVRSIDTDHLYSFEKRNFFYNVSRTLNQLPNKELFIKVYKIGNDIYVQSQHEKLTIEGWSLTPVEEMTKSLIGQSDINSEPFFEKDAILINGYYYRFVSLYDFPSSINFNSLTSLGDIFVNFIKTPVEVAKAKAQRASRKHGANIAAKNTKQVESEKAVDETEEIYERLIDGETSLFKAQFWFVIKESSRQALNNSTDYLIERLELLEATPLVETVANKSILKSFLPTNFISFTRSFDTPSEYLACLLPYTGDHIHTVGVDFLSTNHNLVSINIFDSAASNYNAIITGKSGSGKSMLAQKIVSDLIRTQGASAVILDKGNSFLKITKYYGGNRFSEKFNPLQFLNPSYLKEFVLSVTTTEEVTKKMQGEIYSAIEDFLATKKKKKFKEFLSHLEDFIPDIKHYFSEITPYITDDDIEIKSLTHIDTTIYPASIRPAVIIYAIEYFKNIVGRKLFFFEECWENFKNNPDYIEECFRTFRKMDASAIAITQGVTDFLNQNVGVGEIVFNNSCHKFYLGQDRIPEKLIHEEDIEIITSLRTVQGMYSEFLYKEESLRKVCRFAPNEIEYELFTSKKTDNDLIERFISPIEETIGFKRAMEKWVDVKYLEQ